MAPFGLFSSPNKKNKGGNKSHGGGNSSSSSSSSLLHRVRTSPAPSSSTSSSARGSSTVDNKSTSLISLGTGEMTHDGKVSFLPSPESKKQRTSPLLTKHSSVQQQQQQQQQQHQSQHGTAASEAVQKILRISCSFLRVADLGMDEDDVSTTHESATTSSCLNSSMDISTNTSLQLREPNIHHAAVDPPPGMDMDPKERWIALTTDTDGSHAPIAPIAMDRLANFGFTTSLNESMWIPDSKTDRILKKATTSEWMKSTFRPGKIHFDEGIGAIPEEVDEVLVWSGSFKHGLYGSDLPAIRAAGIVNMSAKSLMELLVDSTRVKEYNKLSLGRQDLVTFDGDLQTPGPFGMSITKVMKSENRPPMIRKNLIFVSILHAKELIDGSGYLIVTRAVHRPEEEKTVANAIQSEILMGVNLIRKVHGAEDSKCFMINVNHIRSPMVPVMVAKRIGVASAVGFVNDIRALCS
ncbi:hypothetical protein IV203_030272 [Nitzschia inconspicua]|uniref:Uncharacterized protein n=1 Tax=Nitzschia inconspicua TaxID=303405 RepID=A0A9K3Q1R2_9STRA|nr:hypothetical protein IV203_030272 [Nitzschia inconspicua]